MRPRSPNTTARARRRPGFDHHLTKPVELATVRALLAAVAGHIS
jgi:hypothetical protein